MPEYKFVINGAVLSCLNDDVLSSGNVGTYKCSFIFADGLQGMTWFASFKKSGRQSCAEITDGECLVPPDMLDGDGTLYIGVFASMLDGTKQFKRLSTNFVALKVNCGAYDEFVTGVPSLWERCMIKLRTHTQDEILNHPDGSVTWDKLSTGVKETIDAKANAPHTHQTSDIYSADVVAYDLSYCMGGWAYDGIAIGVEDKSKFLALDKFYMTYGDTVIETKPSSFVDDNHTAEEFWGKIHPEYYRGLHVFLYTGAEFDVQSHKQVRLDPIFKKISLSQSLIKNLTDGEAEGALKSKNASGALSKDSVALGDGCVAGSKCFNILAFDDTNKSYTLDSVEGLDVGDVFCLKLNRNFDNFGSIIEINGNTVTVDNYQPNETSDVKYFRVPEKPTCGTIDFGIGALAGGENSMAQGDGAFTWSRGGRSMGRYAVTFGRNTEAGYAALAGGRDVHILSPYSFGYGYDNIIKQIADKSAVFGRGLICSSPNQFIFGQFNEEDSNGIYTIIVGNGLYSVKRSNAYTLDREGNAWYAGDIESAKFGKLSDKIGKNTIGTYCKYNLVAGITSQLYVAIAYPIPGVAKYALIVNGKQLGETTSVGQPLKIASILSTTTKSYLCFMDVVNNPIFYAQMNDGIENSAFTTGVLLHFVPTDPWKPEGGTKVPEAGEDFE